MNLRFITSKLIVIEYLFTDDDRYGRIVNTKIQYLFFELDITEFVYTWRNSNRICLLNRSTSDHHQFWWAYCFIVCSFSIMCFKDWSLSCVWFTILYTSFAYPLNIRMLSKRKEPVFEIFGTANIRSPLVLINDSMWFQSSWMHSPML